MRAASYRPILVLFLLLGWLAAAPSALALDVRQTQWGYDGLVVPGTFNLLSVLVSNSAPLPFDGLMELAESGPIGPRNTGPHVVVPCYLAPGAARWVQFYVFFDSTSSPANAEWIVYWGRSRDDRYPLDAPKIGAPARVLLADPDDFSAHADAPRIKRFPDNLFPPTVTATDGLAEVVLDHVPRWEPARRAAFFDWLRRGGRAHVVPDAAGRRPAFTDELAALNTPGVEQERVGAGTVVYHAAPSEDLLKAEPPAPTLETSANSRIYNLEETLLQRMGRLIAPHINWPLIWLLAALYLFAIGPGHYLWVKKARRDYRLSLLVFFAGVTGFSLLFGYVGRRGLGERGKIFSIAWARALDDGHYDVMQWSNAFVTSGGDYRLTHPSAYNLYSDAGGSDGFANGALNGLNGFYQVDMPLYSSCGLVHRGVMAGDSTAATVKAWKTENDKLAKLSVTLPDEFSKARCRAAWARYRDRYYPLALKDGGLEIAGNSIATDDFFKQEELYKAMGGYYGLGNEDEQEGEQKLFENCERAVLARIVGAPHTLPHYVDYHRPPEDGKIDIFLVTSRVPDTFRLTGCGAASEVGMVIYQRTLYKPQAR